MAQPILIGGVEPKLLTMNLAVAFFMVFSLKFYWWIPVTWVIHQISKNLTKNDPFARVVYMTYQLQADRYEPYPESNPRRGLRPKGMGDGVVG